MEGLEQNEKSPYDELYVIAESKFTDLFPASKKMEDRERRSLIMSFLGDVMEAQGLNGFVFHRYGYDKQKELLSKYSDLSEIFSEISQDVIDHYKQKTVS